MDGETVDTCGGPLGSDEAEGWGEDELVSRILCRLAQLRRVGCDSPECVVLAGRLDVELGGLTGLVGRGCPLLLALQILL